MKYLHTMIRVSDPEETLRFFELLGLKEVRRMDNEAGRFTLIFLAAPGDEEAQIELTHNWDEQGYGEGRNFGHIAYRVENVYETCRRLMEGGVTISRPENLSTENSMGFEFVVSSDIFEWWTLNGSANLFRSIVNGENLGENFYADTYSWFARVNSRMNLKVVNFQTMFNYRAPAKTTQGRREAFNYVDLALTRDVFGDKGLRIVEFVIFIGIGDGWVSH